MAAKIGSRNGGGTKALESVPIEKRWTVISESTQQRIFLPSNRGLTEEEAITQMNTILEPSRAVPVAALDSRGILDESLLPEAIAASRVEDEE
jgi:hypothetical protein